MFTRVGGEGVLSPGARGGLTHKVSPTRAAVLAGGNGPAAVETGDEIDLRIAAPRSGSGRRPSVNGFFTTA